MIFASSTCTHEHRHAGNVRDFPPAKLDSKINKLDDLYFLSHKFGVKIILALEAIKFRKKVVQKEKIKLKECKNSSRMQIMTLKMTNVLTESVL